MTFLGIDIGTSAVKAVLVGGDQQLLAEAEASLAISRPHPLWSEQEPEDWWAATRSVLAELRAAASDAYGGVVGIGLSGQMHGAVVLDADDRPLRPAILWNDGRAQAECRLLAERVPEIGRIAGVPPTPGYTAPKLLWLAAHEPVLFARIAKVLLAKDYVRLRLTGEHVTDPVDAAGTLWLDEARRAWSPEILAASGLSEDQVPRVVEGSELSGAVRAAAAAELGLPTGLPVAAGAGDAAAGAIGIGAIADGDAFVSLGTSAQYFVSTATYRPYPERLIQAYCHGLPGRWYQCAALLNGASCLGWAARLLGEPDIPALVGRVETRWRGPSRVLFLPYLAGERTPHDDPHARGVLFGLDADTDAVEVAQAVMEGVAFSLAEAQDCLSAAGTEVAALAAIGGGARSPFWMRLLATVLDRPVTLYAGAANGPAFGAARLPGWRSPSKRRRPCAASPRWRRCWSRSGRSWRPISIAAVASATSTRPSGPSSPLRCREDRLHSPRRSAPGAALTCSSLGGSRRPITTVGRAGSHIWRASAFRPRPGRARKAAARRSRTVPR